MKLTLSKLLLTAAVFVAGIFAQTCPTGYTLTAGACVQNGGSVSNVSGIVAGANGGTGVANTGRTLTLSNNLTLAGTDGTVMTFPATSATLARADAANTFTGHQTIEGVATAGATGTGNLVFANSPSLTTPTLGVAAATTVNKLTITAPATGSTLAVADGKVATVSNTLTLAGTDSTTMTFPTTSATIARTDAANTFTGHQTIEGTATTGATGTGNLVFATSPSLTTPTLGVAAATTVNKLTITAPATGSTLAVADGKVATVSNTLTLAGTDSTTMTFPTTSATIARTDAANTFTGHQTIEGTATTGASGTGNLIFSNAPTLTGKVLFSGIIQTVQGTRPTYSGCGTPVTLTGGPIAGTFVALATSCTPVLTMSLAASTGWSCVVNDLTTPANLFHQSASGTGGPTFTGTAVVNDVINFGCIAY